MISVLRLAEIGTPPFSVRGVTQTLEPIEAAGQPRRTVNGELKNAGLSQFKKFQSTLSCEDMSSPALPNVSVGTIFTVDCIPEIAVAGTLPPNPDDWDENERPIVEGSLRERDGFIYYRPRLTMMVMGHSVEKDEFGAVVSWQIDMEEV